jgi:hypothetical protein
VVSSPLQRALAIPRQLSLGASNSYPQAGHLTLIDSSRGVVAQAARETISINAVNRDVSLFSNSLIVFTSSRAKIIILFNYMKSKRNPQFIEGGK